MISQKMFDEILKVAFSQLKPKGYKKVGRKVYYKECDNYGLVTFQKSVSSTSKKIVTTINLGIYSSLISTILERGSFQNIPNFLDCVYTTRIGFLTESNKDKWWTLETSQDVDNFLFDMEHLISLCHNWIASHISDKQLFATFSASRSNLLEYSILVAKYGNSGELEAVKARLIQEGKWTKKFLDRHIEKISLLSMQ